MAAFVLAVALLGSLDLDALEAAEDAELARLNWAAGMREIRLWEDGVEDEVMVMVNQNADKAEIMDPVSHQGILTLQSWTLVVLENQLVVAYNGQPRASERNEYASRMACTDVYGVAMFMLVARKPVENRPNLHELTFFTADLWDNYVTYVNMAREGRLLRRRRAMTANPPQHAAREWREPWTMRKPTLDVVARPRLIANADVQRSMTSLLSQRSERTSVLREAGGSRARIRRRVRRGGGRGGGRAGRARGGRRPAPHRTARRRRPARDRGAPPSRRSSGPCRRRRPSAARPPPALARRRGALPRLPRGVAPAAYIAGSRITSSSSRPGARSAATSSARRCRAAAAAAAAFACFALPWLFRGRAVLAVQSWSCGYAGSSSCRYGPSSSADARFGVSGATVAFLRQHMMISTTTSTRMTAASAIASARVATPSSGFLDHKVAADGGDGAQSAMREEIQTTRTVDRSIAVPRLAARDHTIWADGLPHTPYHHLTLSLRVRRRATARRRVAVVGAGAGREHVRPRRRAQVVVFGVLRGRGVWRDRAARRGLDGDGGGVLDGGAGGLGGDMRRGARVS